VCAGSSSFGRDEIDVHVRRLLRHDEDATEVAGESRHVDLGLLLRLVALGQERQPTVEDSRSRRCSKQSCKLHRKTRVP
jgi:hypothetical protein